MLTKRLLKECLIRLLKEESIYKLSVRALCDGAGINRTTFYKYYATPFELLGEIEEDMLMRVQETLMQSEEDRTSGIAGVCRYLEENIELSRMLINNNVDPQFPEKLFSMPYVRAELEKTLEAEYDAGDIAYASCFLTYGCYWTVRRWINAEKREPPEKIAALLMKMIGGTASEGMYRAGGRRD